jgi:hypothetical protein
VGRRQTECGGALALYPTGNASHPTALPRHDGCCRVTPLRPHRAHLADWRNLLLEASGPHRMINGIIATGALCRQAELVQCARPVPFHRAAAARAAG